MGGATLAAIATRLSTLYRCLAMTPDRTWLLDLEGTTTVMQTMSMTTGAPNTTPGRETKRLSMCSFTPVIMWLPTTTPTVMEVAVAPMPVMELLDNMDLAELLTQTNPFWFHTPRCVVVMD